MIYFFPGDFVFWASAPKHSEIKAELLPLIQKDINTVNRESTNQWLCKVNTEFFDKAINSDKYLRLITQGIYPVLDDMFLELHSKRSNFYVPKSSQVTDIWYNHYTTASNQEVHNHQNRERLSNFSGIYLLDMNEENKTVLFSYNASLFDLGPNNKRLKEAVEGDIIIFPSYMLHYVLPCEKARTTVAFNVLCNYD